jgi:predicted nucleic acid-binding protein
MTVARVEIAADASFIINLAASAIALELLDIENLYLLVPDKVYEEVKRDRRWLDSIVAAERAHVVPLPRAAEGFFVEAAAIVDEGESATIALARHMAIGVATDDGCAINYWHSLGEDARGGAVGICDVLRAAQSSVALSTMKEVLLRIRRDANFAPPRAHAAWWNGVLVSP